MSDSFEITSIFSAPPSKMYKAWIDSKEHSDFTGAEAKIVPKINGKFKAWDGYICGKTLELQPNSRIKQSWRTTEFPNDSPDSIVDVEFKKHENGTKLILKHTNIPEGQGEGYKIGWKDYYFNPMKEYFKNIK